MYPTRPNPIFDPDADSSCPNMQAIVTFSVQPQSKLEQKKTYLTPIPRPYVKIILNF